MNLMSLTAVELGKKIKSGEVTAVEATKAALEQIKKLDGTYNCYVTVDEEAALKEAEEVQKKIEAGELTGPLAGVPVAVKDNMCTEGMLTTCSSKILYNFKPTYTAEAVLNLKKAGADCDRKRQTWMSLPWEVPRRLLISVRRRIPGIRNMYRAVLPAEAVRQWQPRSVLMH